LSRVRSNASNRRNGIGRRAGSRPFQAKQGSFPFRSARFQSLATDDTEVTEKKREKREHEGSQRENEGKSFVMGRMTAGACGDPSHCAIPAHRIYEKPSCRLLFSFVTLRVHALSSSLFSVSSVSSVSSVANRPNQVEGARETTWA
jgi:hypothetical protein